MRALRIVLTVGALLSCAGVVTASPAAAGGGGGGGCHRDYETGPIEGTGSAVDLVEGCMTPTVLRVEPGTTVTFTNRDDMLHNLFGSGMFVGEFGPQRSVGFRFDDAGTYAYGCTLHPGMVGAIVVGDGRRIAPPTRAILPVEVQPVSSVTSTSLAVVPAAATAPAATEADALPILPAATTVGAVALVAYVAGRRRRVRPTS